VGRSPRKDTAKRERGRVMEHMDIYDMSFDELVDYIGDGDPAEILG
jgi:hypothetical protein